MLFVLFNNKTVGVNIGEGTANPPEHISLRIIVGFVLFNL
jgi:hypothetical protein